MAQIKGVILAGGKGTRLKPATDIYNKHLALVYDKPMVLFPIETLKSLGVTDIMLVTGGEHIGDFTEFLGDGSEYGIRLTYRVQPEAGGIGQALQLAKDFVGKDNFYVILGDNIFDNSSFTGLEPKNPCIFVKPVKDAYRFGVFDLERRFIIEKPKIPPSNLAVTGLYYYSPRVFDFQYPPSARGEIEITDINNAMLKEGMDFKLLEKFWRDAGTPDSLIEAANYIKSQNEHNKST